MDWRLIISVVVIGALVAAFLVTRRAKAPKLPNGSQQPNAAPRADPEIARRFLEALKAQS